MIDLGDFPAGHTAVCIPWDSFAASTGAPAATTNFAAGDVQIYKNGGTTQRSSSAGITVSTSFDGSTGLQLIVIDLSDNTDAGFYAAGNEYQVAVADVTIDGQTVRFWGATFSIERAGGVLALFKARIPAALVGGRMDSSIGAVAANAITAAGIADNAIDRATFAADTGLQSIRSNTAQAGGASTITLDAGASAVDSFYNGTAILTTGGTGAGQFRTIISYVGATKVATVDSAWATAPDNTTTFAIFPAGASATDIATAVMSAMNTTTFAEPAQGAPAATASLVTKIGFLYKAWRNRSSQTATAYKLYNDDAATVDHKATVSDDGTTFESGEKATGP